MTLTTKKIALTALMCALAAVLTLVSVPLPGGGYYNFGDVAIFVSSAALGPYLGALVGAIGGALGDLCLGYTLYAPFTLAIKALEALIAGLIFKACKKAFAKEGGRVIKTVLCALSGVVGGVVMAAGYFVAEGLLLAEGGWQGGIVNLPWNILQGVASAVIAAAILFLCRLDKLFAKVLLSERGKDGKPDGAQKTDERNEGEKAKSEKGEDKDEN